MEKIFRSMDDCPTNTGWEDIDWELIRKPYLFLGDEPIEIIDELEDDEYPFNPDQNI